MPLELVHTDTCGPFRKRTPRGEEYLILFIDDFSRFVWLGLMKHKDEAFEKFKAFIWLKMNQITKSNASDLIKEGNLPQMNFSIFVKNME